MNILVTGSAGFIGHHLVLDLIRNGYNVIGIDNINSYYDINLKYCRLSHQGIQRQAIDYNCLISSHNKKNYKFIKLDLNDGEALNQLFESSKFDLVYNLAAQAGVRYSLENPQLYIDSNIVGFVNILESCRLFSVKHLFYASSSSVYGKSKDLPLSESNKVDNPVSLYAATKRSNELLAQSYHNLYSLVSTGLRFFTVYGPWGRPDMAYYLFTDAILKEKPINIYNNGELKRDFTYIDDVVNAISLVSEKRIDLKDNSIINIGNNKPEKLLDFIKLIELYIGKDSIKVFDKMQKGDVFETRADIAKLINLTGFKPRVNIDEGLKKYVDWHKKYIN